jgi:hypothetical protein
MIDYFTLNSTIKYIYNRNVCSQAFECTITAFECGAMGFESGTYSQGFLENISSSVYLQE